MALSRRQRRTAIRGTQYGVLVVVVVLVFPANWGDIGRASSTWTRGEAVPGSVHRRAEEHRHLHRAGFALGLVLGLLLALMRLSSVPPYRWFATPTSSSSAACRRC